MLIRWAFGLSVVSVCLSLWAAFRQPAHTLQLFDESGVRLSAVADDNGVMLLLNGNACSITLSAIDGKAAIVLDDDTSGQHIIRGTE